MSRSENVKSFDFYCEEIGEFANNVKDGIYEWWESKDMIQFDIEEVEKILQNAKEDKALSKSDLTIIRDFGEDTIDKIKNQQQLIR